MAYEIPLQGGAEYAHQTFTVNIAEREITFKLDYCGYVDHPFWNLDLLENGVPLIEGLTIQGGCDLIAPYHLDLGKLFLVGDEPTLDNLGVANTLLWVSEDEEI